MECPEETVSFSQCFVHTGSSDEALACGRGLWNLNPRSQVVALQDPSSLPCAERDLNPRYWAAHKAHCRRESSQPPMNRPGVAQYPSTSPCHP